MAVLDLMAHHLASTWCSKPPYSVANVDGEQGLESS